MSEPQTDAYFALTSSDPGGHSSIIGFGEGTTRSWFGAVSRAAQQEQSRGLPTADSADGTSVSEWIPIIKWTTRSHSAPRRYHFMASFISRNPPGRRFTAPETRAQPQVTQMRTNAIFAVFRQFPVRYLSLRLPFRASSTNVNPHFWFPASACQWKVAETGNGKYFRKYYI